MASIATYEAYKESGMEWVGEIPVGWKVKPLLACADTECTKNGDGKEVNVLSLSYGRIVRRDVEQNYGLLPESFNTYQFVDAGDVILRLTDLQNDKRSLRVGHALEQGIITSAYLKLSAKAGCFTGRYLYLLLHSYDTTKVFYGMGGGLRQSMKFDDMRRLPMLVPSLVEQEQISNFLDHHTARIDTLIDKQQQLVKLLEEKRQAVISHAVTKGLDPDVPMKDSGLEWLGKVPEHWEIPRLKYAISDGTSISYGIVQPGESLDDGVPFVQTTNMSRGTFEIHELQKTTPNIANSYPRSRLIGGEVILGIRASIGAAYVVPNHLTGANLSRGVARIVPSKDFTADFLVAVLRSTATQDYWHLSKQGSTFNEVSIESVRELAIPLPPIEEQKTICAFLDEKLALLDRLSDSASTQTNLLKERRTALISAAVTGKIDVREWQPEQNEFSMEACA